MSEQGKILIRKSKKGKWIFEVDIHKKQPMKIPTFYDLKDDSFNGKECEVIREKGQIEKIIVDGEELPKKPGLSKPNSGKFDKKHSKNTGNGYGNMARVGITDSLDIEKSMIPDDTKKALTGIKDVDNFNLKFNKLARFENDKFKFFETGKEGIKYQIRANFSEEMIKDISKRYYDSIRNLNLKLSEELVFKPEWRMIIGLGNESVYETSMTLHHIYGIPYIPGSAIKGVVRSYIITEEFGKKGKTDSLDLKNAENMALQDSGFCDIFGNESKRGKMIFFDAFPIEVPKIEPDVINVHYPDYYGGSEPPADYQNPKPIFFLTVKETPFQFVIGMKNRNNTMIDDGKFKGQSILDVAKEYLKEALLEHGVGAKTAVGYGYMKRYSVKN